MPLTSEVPLRETSIYFSNSAWSSGASHQLIILAWSLQQHGPALTLKPIHSGQREEKVLVDRAAGPTNGCDVETLRFHLIVPLRWWKITFPLFSPPSQKGDVKTPGRFLASAEILKGPVGHSALTGFLEMFPSEFQLLFSVSHMPDWCGWGWAEWSLVLRWDMHVVGVSHWGRVCALQVHTVSSLSSWLQYFEECGRQVCHFSYLPAAASHSRCSGWEHIWFCFPPLIMPF